MKALRLGAGLALAVALLAAATPARARDELPPRLQAAIFRKIFRYERGLAAAQGEPRVIVLTGRLSAGRGDELVKAFEENGLEAAAGEIGTRLTIDDRTVLYAFPDVPSAELRELALGARALTISGDPVMALSGRVSVALRRKDDGRPEILVNLPEMRAESRELSAALLKLATVVREPDGAPRSTP